MLPPSPGHVRSPQVGSDGKYIVEVEKPLKISDCVPNTRVALRSDSYALHRILPSKVDPLVSLMRVEKVPDATYDMVGGLSKQIQEMKEVIELPIKHPELFEALGVAQPKGILMYGPPGTGKTLLARAVAHHTDCTFIRVSGSELVQKYIGEGSRMVRELFVMAREKAPSIIFMDEVDSIGVKRSDSGRGDSEVQRTMLELLNQLDGFEPSQNIKVVMATNRIDILDPALLRPVSTPPPGTRRLPHQRALVLGRSPLLAPCVVSCALSLPCFASLLSLASGALAAQGRIDRKVEFPAPNEESREHILKIHSRKMNLMRGIDLRKVARMMENATGAECKGVCTEAGMFALRERRIHVTQEDFEMAVGKVLRKDSDKNVSAMQLFR